MNSGWIKLHRKILDWEWYGDTNTRSVFFHLLLTANFEDVEKNGTVIKRGQTLTSYGSLGEKLGMTARQARVSLTHLKRSGCVTTTTTRRGIIVNIENYEIYQGGDAGESQAESQATRQAGVRQVVQNVSPLKEIKNKEIKNNNKIPPLYEDVEAYASERQAAGKPSVDVDAFMNFYESKGWYVGRNKMKDWRAAYRTWEKRNAGEAKKSFVDIARQWEQEGL